MHHPITTCVIFLTCLATVSSAQIEAKIQTTLGRCNESDLAECSAVAESLIKDPGLIFPDKASTLDRVCSMWNKLTSCIDNYTTKCYSRIEKIKFDKLFKESVTSMTHVCTDHTYREEYLKYAPCVKKVTTDGEYCGFPYQILIDQISNTHVTMRQLCCTRAKFKSCMLTKTREVCDGDTSIATLERQIPIGSAKPMNITTFAQQVVDKSLAFIAHQCARIKKDHDECYVGNGILLRPNSKGPLSSDEVYLSDGAAANHPQLPTEVNKMKPSVTNFQISQKTSTPYPDKGTSVTGNRYINANQENPAPGTQLELGNPNQKESQLSGVNPTGTEIDDKPQTDKLKLHGLGGLSGKGQDESEKGNRSGKIQTYSYVLSAMCGLLFAIL